MTTSTDSTIQEAEVNSVGEVAAPAKEIQEVAKGSLDFLASLAMPTIFAFLYPTVFQAIWKWLLEFTNRTRDFSQLALGLPRGFGKTTFIKIYILYCILFTNKKFILVINATAGLAENTLADVIDMLEEPNIKKVFGDWKQGIEKDTQSIKKFGFRGRNIILAALGAGTSLRGLNLKNQRPDVMIFDDIQSRECADSDVQSDALLRWMVGTAMKAKSPTGCLFIFVGNMYPTKHSILKKLKTNPTWIKFITGGILADNTSLWEELQPIAQLKAEFSNDLAMGHPEIFFAEVLNDDEAVSNNLIDLSALPPFERVQHELSAGNFIIIDPATDKADADAVSIGYFEVRDTLPVLMELKEGRLSPGDTIREAIRFCLTHNCRLVAIESNAYQYSLNYWFNIVCQQLGIQGIEAVPIYSGSLSKNSRILTMFKSYTSGEIFVAPECKAAVHMQIAQFNPLKRDNTDGLLDLLTYAPKVMSEFSEYVMSLGVIECEDYERIEMTDEYAHSAF